MMRALNEVGAIVQKAALGVGLPVGQAEDLARTAVYMAGNHLPLSPVVEALTEPDAPIDIAWGADKLVVKTGNAAMTAPIVKDGFGTGVVKARLAHVEHAPLVIAMLAEAGLEVSADGPKIAFRRCQKPDVIVGPVDVPDTIWHALSHMAAKTYVPESEASRAGGAGAGLTDND
ncbi:DUF3726 domain-containing protein [Yoonia sediminilitoris]|uniref:Uncharacterized protein DUF3726 n=1 Tax=Yoonia sediminilitoris TaxID=1286148 RepID=A0A2T6KMF8_9RHOB|nr:DUF3726 domain-containing protein [Yoonia sediminilitoris]PUB17361.1 uncharacterized protein DUF3726 [Yoonia sediminilitoris]RCW97656.1 uncharacterized protein DUF3726 [Yoonia sediminilitoris]